MDVQAGSSNPEQGASGGGSSAPTIPGGRYHIVERLSTGAIGAVYKALDTILDRPVAVKCVHLDTPFADHGPDELRERFVREARIAARLQHPNIVTIHDIIATADRGFIIMEFIEGQSLGSLLQERKRLPLPDAVRVISQLASALDYAHGRNVVHRDVKPVNILVSPSLWVWVTDFGIAKSELSTNLTMAGGVLGTPDYMSPEQAKGEDVDARSDLFSLGCVLFECVTGEKPFRSPSLTGVLLSIINDEPVFPLNWRSLGLPNGLKAVLHHALEKNREKRYAAGSELVKALTDVEAAAHAKSEVLTDPSAKVIPSAEKPANRADDDPATDERAASGPAPASEGEREPQRDPAAEEKAAAEAKEALEKKEREEREAAEKRAAEEKAAAEAKEALERKEREEREAAEKRAAEEKAAAAAKEALERKEREEREAAEKRAAEEKAAAEAKEVLEKKEREEREAAEKRAAEEKAAAEAKEALEKKEREEREAAEKRAAEEKAAAAAKEALEKKEREEGEAAEKRAAEEAAAAARKFSVDDSPERTVVSSRHESEATSAEDDESPDRTMVFSTADITKPPPALAVDPKRIQELKAETRPLRLSPNLSGELHNAEISPEEGFLLSRIDGLSRASEILAVSPMPETETVAALIHLLDKNLIQFGGSAAAREAAKPSAPPKGTPDEATVRELDRLLALAKSHAYADFLGVSVDSTVGARKSAYLKLIGRFHPDKFPRADDPIREKLSRICAEASEALDQLENAPPPPPKKEARSDGPPLQAPGANGHSNPSSSRAGAAHAANFNRGRYARELFDRALRAFDLQDFWEAIQLCRQALETDDTQAEYFDLLGRALMQNKKWRKEAADNFRKASELDPSNLRYLGMLGAIYKAEGLQARANAILKKAQSLDPNFALPEIDGEPSVELH